MANTEIDSLELSLSFNADAAASGVDALTASLTRLKTALKGGTGLTAVNTQMKKLKETLDALNGTIAGSSTAAASSLKSTSSAMTSTEKKTKSLGKANNALSFTYTELASKVWLAANSLRFVTRLVASCITQSLQYEENMNLFAVSMGEYAEEAMAYAEKVGELMGIDPGEWMRNQGIFMTLATGFGVAGDKAAFMSKNLTQLGYDMSSLFNMDVSESMQKLQSAIAGELEPVRRVGYDLSQAALKEIALDADNYAKSIENLANALSDEAMAQYAVNQGYTKSFNDMTQAEKSQLRYIAVMKQVKIVQGDMARTLKAPANQLRVLRAQLTMCARSIGNIFIPALNAILPYAIAVVKVIRRLAEAIARLFGHELTEVDYSGVQSAASGAAAGTEDIEDSLGGAASAAKKLKSYLLGIDELNVISPPDDSDYGGAGDSGSVGGASADYELPGYDFMKGLEQEVDKVTEAVKEALKWVAAVGSAFLAWKIARGIIEFIEMLKNLKNFHFEISFAAIGLPMLLQDIIYLKQFLDKIDDEGFTLSNVTGAISEFVSMIADSSLMLGNVKGFAILSILSGIGGIISAISDMTENDINFENVMYLLRSITRVVMAIAAIAGMKTGNFGYLGIAAAINGVVTIIDALGKFFETGNIEDIDKAKLFTGILGVISGVIFALYKFKQFAKMGSAAKEAADTMTTATKPIQTVGDTMKNSLTPKLEQLVVNLGLGLVIIGEVALAAMMIVGVIYILGLELQAVATTWQPVIANGETVVTALFAGAAILGVVGFVTSSIGQVGSTLATNMLIGTGILLLAGAAAAVFIAEVWAIGWGLAQVAEAWQPVIAQGDTVAIAIGVAAGLLLVVGAAAAGLGYLTVATGGTIPMAIGVGTAMLLELGVAVGLFIAEVWGIGKGLTEVGNAWQPVIANGETIATGIETASALLLAIGVVTAALGVLTVASAGLLPVAIGLGTALLVELSAAVILFIESIVAVANSLKDDLSPVLTDLNAVLPPLTDNMSSFVDFMSNFAGQVVRYSEASAIAGLAGTIDTIIGWFTQDPIDKMAADAEKIATQAASLNEKLNIANPELETAVTLLTNYTGFVDQLGTLSGAGANTDLSTGLKANLKDAGAGIVVGFADGIRSNYALVSSAMTDLANTALTTFETAMTQSKWSTFGTTIVKAFATAINSASGTSRTAITAWANNIKRWFSDTGYGDVSKTRWETYARQIVEGFNSGINAKKQLSQSAMTSWASSLKSTFSNGLVEQFTAVGRDVVSGFNNGLEASWRTSLNYISTWAREAIYRFKSELNSNSPSKVFIGIGEDTVEGYNIGVENSTQSTLKTMSNWANSFTGIAPTVSVDTRALEYANKTAMSRTISGEVVGTYKHTVSSDGFADNMERFYREYVQPTLNDIAYDTKRQADKQEITNVRIGNRDVRNAVIEQQRAGGYVFAT